MDTKTLKFQTLDVQLLPFTKVRVPLKIFAIKVREYLIQVGIYFLNNQMKKIYIPVLFERTLELQNNAIGEGIEHLSES